MKIVIIFLFLDFLRFYSFAQTTYIVETSNIKLPIDNTGHLAYVDLDLEVDGGTYDNIAFLFSAGFLLSGKNGDSIWANGQAGSMRLADYLPGNVDSNYNDPKYKLYTLTSSDEPFGDSWLQWKLAVQLGADYYDGDGDGQYNPVDLNGNGNWDINEDKPDLLGDFTTWCVYNDGITYENRKNIKGHPQGIEIRQTIFTFRDSQFPESPINNTIFVRYRIINSGKFTDNMDSVYFSAWADPDIGYNYNHDLAGCDTILNSGFAYKDTSDDYFGSNPPSYLLTLLQGPYAFIAGDTFFDSNSNGLYDEGVDIPLDTAYSIRGSLLGIENIIGAKNLNMTSFMHTMKAVLGFDDPIIWLQVRNYLLGLKPDGTLINPCNWMAGTIYGGVECFRVNPHYCYSGDPLIPLGWINNIPHEQRLYVNTGPFILKKNQAIDIIVAHTAARGESALHSLRDAKIKTRKLILWFNNNWLGEFTEEAPEVNSPKVVSLYSLEQNYPNPFNASTKINFNIRSVSPLDIYYNDALHVKLKVYDIIGNEVAVLFDEPSFGGEYQVEFNTASGAGNKKSSEGYPSGVYFYRLTAGDYVQTKKMVLVR